MMISTLCVPFRTPISPLIGIGVGCSLFQCDFIVTNYMCSDYIDIQQIRVTGYVGKRI